MPRANGHFLQGQGLAPRQRCHEHVFLLKFVRDRCRSYSRMTLGTTE